ncbi:MAG: dethiobiotin synthase [Myxococcales bacterium]|nr:dethiobiotin synthase [Myxococcales bacterium]
MIAPPGARRLFVTGTDTGVGKTRVACGLIAAWRNAGRRVAPFKPIETGCLLSERDGLLPADGARLLRAAGDSLDLDLVSPIRFGLPASPAAAAAHAGRSIDLALLDRAAATLAAHADLLLIEGAGGLLVPVAPGVLMADLAARFASSILIVARSSLGTINHTLLTLEAARLRGLPVVGVILNQLTAGRGPDEDSNAAMIGSLGSVPVFGTLPHLPGDPDLEVLGGAASEHLDLAALWRCI